jgi:hypothetical protein
MIRKSSTIVWILGILTSACGPKEISIMSSLTFNDEYEAERTYHTKSKKSVYYDALHRRTLTFKGGDTLIVEDDSKITSVLYRLDFYKWSGKQKFANAIYDGVDSTFKMKTIRITLNEVEKEKFALITSEVMDGEYDPAADSIWTYYKYKNTQ